MDNKDKNQEFTLEDIMREFGGDVAVPAEEAVVEVTQAPSAPLEETAPAEEIPEAEEATESTEAASMDAEEAPSAEAPAAVSPETKVQPTVSTADTIRLDTLFPERPENRHEAEPSLDETRVLPELSEAQDAPAQEEPAAPQQAPAPQPIQFRSRLSELKRKLVAGPEKRYYDLSEIGLGRIQIAIFINLLVVALCAGGTALYAMGMVLENRLRLMVFSQILAMMVSALLGCYVLLDGIIDLFTGKFSLNTMLFLTLAACSADAAFCLQELRVPCCAAFCLEMTFALWNRSLRRSTEMGQMDTLRKANRLDGIVKVPNYMDNGPAILRTEGSVEDFMDNYARRSGPERTLNIYALLSVLACVGIAVLAGTLHNLSLAIQVFSTSMLVAVPASAFVSQSRPAAILERRMHMVGTVLCGWKGIQSLCGKASFPLFDKDLFPMGSVKLNGVKFLNGSEPEPVISAAASLMRQRSGGLEPVFTQLLKSRGGKEYDVADFCMLSGGVAGEVNGESCLLGIRECLTAQGVEIPAAAQVNNAVYFAADGVLTAVFVLNYSRTRASAGGLVTINGCRKLRPMILCRNFMITPQLLKEKFGIRAKRYAFPDPEDRDAFAAFVPDPELMCGALTTQQNLSSMAYAVTGSRALRGACRTGVVLHIFAGILGLLIMAALAYMGDMRLLSPFNILLFQLVWMLPGLLITEWARTV